MDSDIPSSFEVVKIDQLSLDEIREEPQKKGLSSKGNRRTVAKRLKDHLIHIRNKAFFLKVALICHLPYVICHMSYVKRP